MDPKTPQYWAKLFWEHFSPQVESGKPVYLTFDTSLIRKLYNKNFPEVPLEAIKIEEYFNTAHAQLLCLDKVKATLTPLALEKQKNKFSCAIVLAAQQILVVEEMTTEETKKFTHDAYFPRYREKINFIRREGLKHNNPIETHDFYKLWSTLRDEILSISGADTSSVTFKPGNGTKNRTRNFPISQALFSQDDLQKLYEKVSDQQRASHSFYMSDSLLSFFDQNKSQLTKRARDKIDNYGLRNALFDQFKYFLKNPKSTPSIRKKPASTAKDDRGIFIVSLKATGFKKSYRLIYKIDFKRTFFQEQAWEYLKNLVKRDDIFILTYKKGIGYSNEQAEGEVKEDDPFILFYKDEKENGAKLELDNLFGRDWDKTLFGKLDLEKQPSDYNFYICEGLPNEIGVLLYKSNRLVVGEIIPAKELLKCAGGIILNKTQNFYLKDYPPDEFYTESYKLSPDDIVTVNHTKMKVCDLRSRLLKVDTYDSFHITYKNFKLDLIIKSIPETTDLLNPIGFELINDEILSPIAGENDLEIPSLRGWVLPYDEASFAADKEFTLEMFEVAWLMRGSDRTWIPTTEGAIQLVIDNLPTDRVSSSIGKILENRLLVNKSLPVSLIKRHKDLELAHTN